MPLKVPAAPEGWHPNPDQISRVAQDPRLHKLSRDELYIYFNPAKPKGNVFHEFMRSIGVPDDWMAQAFSWHPTNTLNRASNALRDANEGMGQ